LESHGPVTPYRRDGTPAYIFFSKIPDQYLFDHQPLLASPFIIKEPPSKREAPV